MPHGIVKICEPSNAFHADIFSAVFVHTASRCVERIIIWNIKFPIPAVNTRAKPQFIILDKRENFFISNSIDISDNQKILLICHKLCYILPKQAKRWIRNNNVRLFEIFDAFLAAKIPVAL